ncbi:uncharacterized protein LOC142590413 isoform X1 [Dermacentor variabilis]|uniref:uncharacterized protein LOC142590413 isoform X1 n=1 Tax=Dermacentor variabilis TaxID=34621 RepID=UPI003F5BD5CF
MQHNFPTYIWSHDIWIPSLGSLTPAIYRTRLEPPSCRHGTYSLCLGTPCANSLCLHYHWSLHQYNSTRHLEPWKVLWNIAEPLFDEYDWSRDGSDKAANVPDQPLDYDQHLRCHHCNSRHRYPCLENYRLGFLPKFPTRRPDAALRLGRHNRHSWMHHPPDGKPNVLGAHLDYVTRYLEYLQVPESDASALPEWSHRYRWTVDKCHQHRNVPTDFAADNQSWHKH